MDLTALTVNYPSLVEFLKLNGYFAMFILMCIEGPVITLLSAFAASFNYFNIWIVVGLSILGDFVGDTFHYFLGRAIRAGFIKKGVSIKNTNARNLHQRIHKNLLSTLIIAKAASPIAGATIVVIGTTRVGYLRFIKNSFIATLPFTFTYIILGYFFGTGIKQILQYIELSQNSAAIAIVAVIILIIAYKLLSPKIRAFLIRNKYIKEY